MKILFLGSVIRSEDCTKHLGPSVAGNRMQLGLIKGLETIYKENLTVISQYPIAAYPREKKILIKYSEMQLTDKLKAKKIPFLNLFILKQITKIINTFVTLLIWGVKNKNEEKVIICYNAFSDTALPVLYIKKLIKAKTICLVADLPIDGVFKENRIKKIARHIDYFFVRKNIKKFDGLAVLNKNALTEYAPSASYAVIDGGFDEDETPKNPPGGQWVNTDEKELLKVIYSGALIEYNGIKNLIEAAKLVQNNRFTLEIYGKGPMEDYVIKSSKGDDRIIYKGLVSSEEILRIQRNSALLVSPLLPEHPVAKVAFPSKIVEYMVSGTPVVSTKVNSLGQDYLERLYIFENQEPEIMAETIDRILSLDKEVIIKKGQEARRFIVENKNWEMQSKKIVKLISEIY